MAAPILGKLGAGLGKVADKTDFGTKGLVGQAKDALQNGYTDPLGFNQQAQGTGNSLTHDSVKKATDKAAEEIKPSST